MARLGESRFDSPLADFVAERRSDEHHVDQHDRVILHDTVSLLTRRLQGDGVARSVDDSPASSRAARGDRPRRARTTSTSKAGRCSGRPGAPRTPDRVVDRLVPDGIDIVFVIGILRTLDNDIPFIGQRFGPVTGFSVAARSIDTAMGEARSAAWVWSS